MRITWSPLALSKAERIASSIAEDNPSAAERWVESLFDAVSRLDRFPESGAFVPEIRSSDLREVLHGQYRVIYKITKSEIQILTVRHASRILRKSDLSE